MIDQYPPANGVLTSLIWRKTAAGGETSLSGYDNANQALSYTPGQEQVYLNGILLVRGDDYTATNGTSITGLAALSASDFVQINCYNNFSVASVPTTSLTGEVTNSQITSLATSKLTGTIANNQLANSSITINGSAVSLGGSTTIAGGSAQDDAPTSPTEGQLWLDTNGTLSSAGFTEKATLTTTGDIYYASAANTPARLGIGSTDQVLKVSGGVPVWATPAAGGGLTLINTGGTALSGASVSITSIPGTYKNLHIYIENFYMGSNNNNAYIQFNTTTSDNYAFMGLRRSGGNAEANATEGNNDVGIYFSSVGGTTAQGAFAYILVPNYAATNHRKVAMGVSYTKNDGSPGDYYVMQVTGVLQNSSSAITSVQVVSNGTYSGGTVYIYGEN